MSECWMCGRDNSDDLFVVDVNSKECCQECGELAHLLLEQLSTARHDGRTSHENWTPESYKQQSKEEHLMHAGVHVDAACLHRDNEDHIAHAICRLVMALA